MPKNSYYDDDADDQHDAVNSDSKDSTGNEKFIPKSMLGDSEYKVGDTFKITSIASDEIGVVCEHGPSDAKDEEKTEPSDNPEEEAGEGASDTGSEMAMSGGEGKSNSMYE